MRQEYLTPHDQINKVSEQTLLKALQEVNRKNIETRKSFLHPNDSKLRCTKHIHF